MLTSLAYEKCCDCGVIFGMADYFRAQRKRDQKSFYCPNGHAMSYTESEADELKRRLSQTQEALAVRDGELATNLREQHRLERSIRGLRGRMAQLMRRRRS